MPLNDKAVLLSLTLRLPSASINDMAAASSLATEHGASSKAIKVIKSLFANSNRFKLLATIQREARTYFYENTLPFQHRGSAILPISRFEKVMDWYRRQAIVFEMAKKEFLENLDEEIKVAKMAMGDMWDEEQMSNSSSTARYVFGDIKALDEAIQMELHIDPIPESGHFLVNLQKEELEEIKKEHDAARQKWEHEAQQELRRRMLEPIQALLKHLHTKNKRFKQASIDNAVSAAEDALGMTLNDSDTALQKIATELKKTLQGRTHKDLKEDGELSSEVQKKLDSIMNKVKMEF